MSSTKINIGLEPVGEVDWGTHFCLFYEDKKDLLEILLPYFKEGLENNEYCMWITAEPLSKEDVLLIARKKIPNFLTYLKKNQIEIIPHEQWYLKDGFFDLTCVLEAWIKKLEEALKNGYKGLRVTGNTAWLEKKDWKNFTEYEAEINKVIPNKKMVAICTYMLQKCGPFEIIDVVKNHEFALIRREGKWNYFKSMFLIQTEEKLKASESRFEKIFSNSPIGIEFYDSYGKLIDLNKACLDIFGIKDKNVVIEFDLFNDPNIPVYVLEKLRKLETVRFESEFNFEKVKEQHLYETSKSGFIYIEVVILPLYIKDNKEMLNYLVLVQDITQRKLAEIALKESEDKYRRAYEQVNFYKDLLSHDISNAIQIINSSAEIYSHYKSEPNQSTILEEMLNRITKASNQAIRLIKNLNKISEIEENIEFPLKTIDLCEFLKEAMNHLYQFFPDKDIRLEIDSTLKNIKVYANDLLLDIFENILNNAIKYNDNQIVEILIKISKEIINDIKYVRMEFLDNGIGISDGKKSIIFKKGYKEIKGGKGMGLGLSLVKTLIERYNGKIWVEDRIKGDYTKGCNFILLIPEYIQYNNAEQI